MPLYEYRCEKCPVEFDELLVTRDDVRDYSESYPCPVCSEPAARVKVSAFAFSFKAPGGQTQGSGVHGQSGVHDLDYPALDKAVGRSAAQRWEVQHAKQAARDKVRKETGATAVSETSDGVVKPVAASDMKIREKAIETFTKAIKQPPKQG
jgi:putative FmdB family regulatory protein